MRSIDRILIIQTAFLGDVILTLPLVQVTKDFFGDATIDIVVTPKAAEICQNHPAIRKIIRYDKRGEDRGVPGFRRMAKQLRNEKYDLVIVPHRSMRSALLAFLSNIPFRIGFTRSAGRFLFSKSIFYDPEMHEIDRNLSLLSGLGINPLPFQLPKLYPSIEDREEVEKKCASLGFDLTKSIVAIAPGTIWNTKRWLKERFAHVARMFEEDGFQIALVGSKDDFSLSEQIKEESGSGRIFNFAGEFSILQSAYFIGQCALLISNDSAPMHIAVAMETPVAAIFGATVPAFGFSPRGKHDIVVETRGLACRPCSIHGGNKCPIETFECMEKITADKVYLRGKEILKNVSLDN